MVHLLKYAKNTKTNTHYYIFKSLLTYNNYG